MMPLNTIANDNHGKKSQFFLSLICRIILLLEGLIDFIGQVYNLTLKESVTIKSWSSYVM